MVYVCLLTSNSIACLWLIVESFFMLLDCANCLLFKTECYVD